MNLRRFIIPLSVVLPMIVMLAIIYFASDIGKKAAPNETAEKNPAARSGGMSKAPEKLPDTALLPANVPISLDDARQKAKARLDELQKMTQKQWDSERVKVLHRSPPERIEEAIARTMLRVKDLEVMDEAAWEADKLRIIRREKMIMEIKSAPKLSDEDLRKEVGAMFNKKTPQDIELNEKK